LVVLAVGDRYDPAIGMAQALLAGALVWAACYWLRPLFLAAGRVRAWVVISGAGVACALVMFWPAAVWWGGLGLSLVQLVAAVGAHGVALTRLPQLIAPSREAGGMRTVAP
jgi:O-antigen/teichoic acid export membrane protein